MTMNEYLENIVNLYENGNVEEAQRWIVILDACKYDAEKAGEQAIETVKVEDYNEEVDAF